MAARCLMFCLLSAASCAWADSYSWADPSTGVLHLTDRPTSAAYSLLLKSPPQEPTERPLNGAMAQARSDTSREERKKAVSELVEAAGQQTGVRPELLHAVISAESGYNHKAVSPKGALGLMQLMPETARRYGVKDWRDPLENISGGARYLADLLQMFDQNVKLAVAAYNAGENAVIRYGYRVPPYRETETYVKRVSALYERDRGIVAR